MRVKFKETKNIKEWGRVDYFPRHAVVSVNPAKGGSFDTICHECAHFLYPFLTEKEVKYITKYIVSKATLKDQKEMIEDYIKMCELSTRK